MIYYLDQKKKDWSAEGRMCKSMDISVSYTPDDRSITDFSRAVLQKLISKPWYLFRFIPAYFDYCECKSYLLWLQEEANKVRTKGNSDLVDHILLRTGEHLVRESKKDWSELCGLATQKLVHLQYHEELKYKTFR